MSGIIRRITLTCSWFLGLIAPIKVSYDYVANGKLAPIVPTTHLGIWQVLLNLCTVTTVLLVYWIISIICAAIFVGFPVVFVAAFLIEDKAAYARSMERFMKALLIVVTIIDLPVVLVGALSAFEPWDQPTGVFGWALTVFGGLFLSSSYLYIYLAATGQLKLLDENVAQVE
jgi:SNF family Na+-dependent transporter